MPTALQYGAPGFMEPTPAMNRNQGAHERLHEEAPVAAVASNRAFGVAFAILFTAIALFPLLGGGVPRWWLAGAAAALLAMALLRAEWLAPANRAWSKVALLLHQVVATVILAFLFYAVVTPTGLLMRAFGKDPLRLRPDPKAKSYWIPRSPPGPAPESMQNQF